MEKYLQWIVAPVAGWVGYLHKTRISEKVCEAKHQGVSAQQTALCDKLESVHQDVREMRAEQREMRDMFIEYIVNKK